MTPYLCINTKLKNHNRISVRKRLRFGARIVQTANLAYNLNAGPRLLRSVHTCDKHNTNLPRTSNRNKN